MRFATEAQLRAELSKLWDMHDALKAELTRLRAENEALRSEIGEWVTDYQAQKMRNDRLEWERGNIDEVFRTVSDREIKFRNQAEELRAENEVLRKDAERYRQLVQMTDRGCYQLMCWDTDRDNWYKVQLSDDNLYSAMKGQ